MKVLTLFLIALVFTLGAYLGYAGTSLYLTQGVTEVPQGNSQDVPSPYDHIKEDQIHVYGNKVVIDFRNRSFTWSRYADTNSMDPVFDYGHNGIEVVPKSQEEIHAGDVLVYRHGNSLIPHRCIEIGFDTRGWFCKVKGDNNKYPDPVTIRFNDGRTTLQDNEAFVEYILVGVIY